MAMAHRNQQIISVFISAIIICIIAGIASANFAKTGLRYEEFRMNEAAALPCPETLTEAACKNITIYNPQASGGYEGYPIVSGKYYCTSDASCISATTSKIIGPINFYTLNVAILSVCYFLLFLSFLWIRNRVKRNANKAPDSVT